LTEVKKKRTRKKKVEAFMQTTNQTKVELLYGPLFQVDVSGIEKLLKLILVELMVMNEIAHYSTKPKLTKTPAYLRELAKKDVGCE